MTIETGIEDGQPDFEPRNPAPQTQAEAGLPAKATPAIDDVLHLFFLMPLPAAGDQVPPRGTGIGGDCYVELES
jgi:hypothetical protein